MLLQDFKVAYQVSEIKLNSMPEGSKVSHMGYAVSPKYGKLDVITSTKGCDLKGTLHVYETPVDDIDRTTGDILGKKNLYVLSNKAMSTGETIIL